MRRPNAVGMWGLLAAAMMMSTATTIRAEEGATMSAMQVAYSREVNARIQYLAFATRAGQEAQPSVACLFRALAQAESIHAARHAATIERMDGTPFYTYEDVVVLRTAQNLRTSILGEMRERETVYPLLANYARSEHLYEALTSCEYAKAAEATHERVLRAALWRLEQEEAAQVKHQIASLEPILFPTVPTPTPTYYVCPGDGCVFTHSYTNCPNCGTAGDQAFVHVSGR